MKASPVSPLSVTLITPSLNHGRFIAEAVDSVQDAACKIQHIVVDGGSTDETREVLQGRDVELYIEPALDSHAAINFGFAIARGDLVIVLNSDDRMTPETLDAIARYMADHPETGAVCGAMRFFSAGKGEEKDLFRRGHAPGRDMALELTFGAPGFNSWVFRKSLIEALGGLDVQWSFSADRDLLLRLFRQSEPVCFPDILYHYRVHGASRTMRPDGANLAAIYDEHIAQIPGHRQAWADDPGMLRLLDGWQALEQTKRAGLALGRCLPAPLRLRPVITLASLAAAVLRPDRWLPLFRSLKARHRLRAITVKD